MTVEVVTVAPTGTLSGVLALMAEKNLSSIVVAEEGKPLGIITEAHVFEESAKGNGTLEREAREVADPLQMTLDPEDTTLDAVLRFERAKVGTSVVVNGDGVLVGVVSVTDILRNLRDDHFISRQRVKHSMSKQLTLAGEMTGIRECFRMMVRDKSDCVIVTARGEGVGIFTRRDAIKLLSKTDGAGAVLDPVHRHMTAPLVTVGAESPLFEACTLMEKMHVRRLVVADSRNAPRGILLQRDLLRRLDANYVEILKRAIGEASEKMSMSERKYRMLADESSEGLFMLVDGKIVYVNQSCAALFGYGGEELHGKEFHLLAHAADAALVRMELAEREQARRARTPFRFRGVKAGGAEILVEVSARYIPEANEMALIGTVREVTAEAEHGRAALGRASALRALGEISSAFTRGEAMGEGIKNACAAAVSAGEFVSCAFLLFHGGVCVVEGLALAGAEGVTAASPKLHLPLADHPGLNNALNGGGPMVLDSGRPGLTGAERLFHEKIGARLAAAIPLTINGKRAGIAVFGFSGAARTSPEDVQYQVMLAGQMAQGYENRRLGRMLADSEAQYRELFNSAVDVVFKVGNTGIIEDVNPQFTIITGFDSTEWTGRPFAELFDDPRQAGRLYAGAGRFGGAEFRIKTRRGPKYFFISSWPRYNGLGEAVGKWKVARDITAQKNRETELLRLKERAEAASRAKGAFLANISHELRTPLTAIIGFGTLIGGNQNLPPDIIEHAGIVVEQGKNLQELITNIINYAEMEKVRSQSSYVPVRLSGLLAACAEKEAGNAASRRVAVKIEVDPAVPPVVMADEQRLSQTLNQLINNAVKFTSGGTVTVSAEVDEGHLVFTVTDTGIGIGAEDMANIFDLFSQADESVTRRYGGVGLGLALAKSLVTAMGGGISASSTPGEGSRFRFAVPFAESEETPPAFSVLCADDDELVLFAVRDILGDAGYQITAVRNGREALDACTGRKFDILLLDIVMPGMGGFEVARRVKLLPGYADVPLIAFTAHTMNSEREKAFRTGFNVFLPKPFKPAGLLEAVERELRRVHPGGRPA